MRVSSLSLTTTSPTPLSFPLSSPSLCPPHPCHVRPCAAPLPSGRTCPAASGHPSLRPDPLPTFLDASSARLGSASTRTWSQASAWHRCSSRRRRSLVNPAQRRAHPPALAQEVATEALKFQSTYDEARRAAVGQPALTAWPRPPRPAVLLPTANLCPAQHLPEPRTNYALFESKMQAAGKAADDAAKEPASDPIARPQPRLPPAITSPLATDALPLSAPCSQHHWHLRIRMQPRSLSARRVTSHPRRPARPSSSPSFEAAV